MTVVFTTFTILPYERCCFIGLSNYKFGASIFAVSSVKLTILYYIFKLLKSFICIEFAVSTVMVCAVGVEPTKSRF